MCKDIEYYIYDKADNSKSQGRNHFLGEQVLASHIAYMKSCNMTQIFEQQYHTCKDMLQKLLKNLDAARTWFLIYIMGADQPTPWHTNAKRTREICNFTVLEASCSKFPVDRDFQCTFKQYSFTQHSLGCQTTFQIYQWSIAAHTEDCLWHMCRTASHLSSVELKEILNMSAWDRHDGSADMWCERNNRGFRTPLERQDQKLYRWDQRNEVHFHKNEEDMTSGTWVFADLLAQIRSIIETE